MRAPSEAMITAEIWTTPKREKVKSWGCTFGAIKLTNVKMGDINMLSRESQGSEEINLNDENNDSNENQILCFHCKRTKVNGLSCIGKCVADNEY